MKILLQALVRICRLTPAFRGKWRLERWLEDNRERYFGFPPASFDVAGYEFRVEPRTNFHLYMYGPRKNEKIVPWIRRYVEIGSTALDVGAHNGYFSLVMADAVGPAGHVFAFEASPEIHKELETTVALNRLRQVTTVNEAVSDAGGTLTFTMAPAWKSEISSLRPGEGTPVTIPATRLDDAVPGEQRVSFVKIDIEGAEMKALAGMQAIIRRHRPVMVIEISDPWLRELGSSSREVFDFLHGHGYRIFEIRDHGTVPIEAPPTRQIDALCIAGDAGTPVTGDAPGP